MDWLRSDDLKEKKKRNRPRDYCSSCKAYSLPRSTSVPLHMAKLGPECLDPNLSGETANRGRSYFTVEAENRS